MPFRHLKLRRAMKAFLRCLAWRATERPRSSASLNINHRVSTLITLESTDNGFYIAEFSFRRASGNRSIKTTWARFKSREGRFKIRNGRGKIRDNSGRFYEIAYRARRSTLLDVGSRLDNRSLINEPNRINMYTAESC